jgi:hypothetical protein
MTKTSKVPSKQANIAALGLKYAKIPSYLTVFIFSLLSGADDNEMASHCNSKAGGVKKSCFNTQKGRLYNLWDEGGSCHDHDQGQGPSYYYFSIATQIFSKKINACPVILW